MHWPICIGQDKLALDILRTIFNPSKRAKALTNLGYNPPNTGPWVTWGYWWAWGTSRIPLQAAPRDTLMEQLDALS